MMDQTVLHHKYVFWLMVKASQLRTDTYQTGLAPDQNKWEQENKAVAKFGTVR
jgi:hypothetical protein